ncbi:MAG: CGNR zinc finger domain-containing protein [Solirubrobacteraceae bacterium]
MKTSFPEDIQLRGGALCLDFANSVDWSQSGEHVAPEHTDALREPDMLTRWGRRLGLVGDTAPPSAAGELEVARELREAVYATFAAIAGGGSPAPADLKTLAATHASAAARAELAPAGEAWRLTWPPSEAAAVRFAVARDALELLGDEDRLRRVSRCPGRDCGWLFVNASGRRRWCAMDSCGSREKMRRLYERQRAGV